MSYAVVRMVGQTELKHEHVKTLESLRLHKVHHTTIVPENPSYHGMLDRVEHKVTFGEIDADTIAELLEVRGRGPGDRRLDDDYVAEATDFDGIDDLAQALADGEATMSELDGIKPVFRLSPPRGGFDSTKRHFNEGGALGYRGDAINELIERMI